MIPHCQGPAEWGPYLMYFSPRKVRSAGAGLHPCRVRSFPADLVVESPSFVGCESGEFLLDFGDAPGDGGGKESISESHRTGFCTCQAETACCAHWTWNTTRPHHPGPRAHVRLRMSVDVSAAIMAPGVSAKWIDMRIR